MIEASGEISGLLSSVSGTTRVGGSPLGQTGFGPDFIVELGRQRYAGVPGYGALANFNAASTGTLQLRAGQATTATPVYSADQARQIQATINEAAAALAAGDTDTARARTRVLLQRDFNDPNAHHLLGRIAYLEGDDATALQHFDRASELAPDNQRFADDAFNFRQLQRSDADVLEVSTALVQRRDTAVNGIRLLLELANRSPESGRIYRTIAQGFERLDLPAQQLGAFSVVVDQGTEDDLLALESDLNRFISAHEEVGLAQSLRGRTLQRLGRFDEALQALESAVKIAPEVEQYRGELANIHASVGNLALGRGDHHAAEFRFKKALELDPLNSDLKFGLAAVLISVAGDRIDVGLTVDGRSLLGRASAMLGSDPSLDAELAFAYRRLGNAALADGLEGLALANFEDALKRDPQIAGLPRQMADLYRNAGQAILDETSYAEMSTSDFENVIKNFENAFELVSSRASYRSSLAEVYNEFGLKLMNEQSRYAEAQDMFGKARDLEPANAAYQDHYQQALALRLSNP